MHLNLPTQKPTIKTANIIQDTTSFLKGWNSTYSIYFIRRKSVRHFNFPFHWVSHGLNTEGVQFKGYFRTCFKRYRYGTNLYVFVQDVNLSSFCVLLWQNIDLQKRVLVVYILKKGRFLLNYLHALKNMTS